MYPKINLVFLFLFSLGINSALSSHDPHFKRVCYFTNWSCDLLVEEAHFCLRDIDASLCSHIIYGFVDINVTSLSLTPSRVDDESKDGVVGRYVLFNNLKKEHPHLKTLLSVGGSHQSEGLQSVTSSPTSRMEFAINSITYVRLWGFDGLDLDWEYPGQDGDVNGKESLTLLIQDLRQADQLQRISSSHPPLLLSVAGPASEALVDRGFLVENISQQVDFINLMAYDLQGAWSQVTGFNSPLYPRNNDSRFIPQHCVEWVVNMWLRKGAPASKLVLGIAGYGQSYTLANTTDQMTTTTTATASMTFNLSEMTGLESLPTSPSPSAASVTSPSTAPSNTQPPGPGSRAYGPGRPGRLRHLKGQLALPEICEYIQQGGQVTWDDQQRVPYMTYGDLWVGYDDKRSVTEKVTWALGLGLGGVMFWSLDLDDFKGDYCNMGRYPLLTAISHTVTSLHDPEKNITGDAINGRKESIKSNGSRFRTGTTSRGITEVGKDSSYHPRTETVGHRRRINNDSEITDENNDNTNGSVRHNNKSNKNRNTDAPNGRHRNNKRHRNQDGRHSNNNNKSGIEIDNASTRDTHRSRWSASTPRYHGNTTTRHTTQRRNRTNRTRDRTDRHRSRSGRQRNRTGHNRTENDQGNHSREEDNSKNISQDKDQQTIRNGINDHGDRTASYTSDSLESIITTHEVQKVSQSVSHFHTPPPTFESFWEEATIKERGSKTTELHVRENPNLSHLRTALPTVVSRLESSATTSRQAVAFSPRDFFMALTSSQPRQFDPSSNETTTKHKRRGDTVIQPTDPAIYRTHSVKNNRSRLLDNSTEIHSSTHSIKNNDSIISTTSNPSSGVYNDAILVDDYSSSPDPFEFYYVAFKLPDSETTTDEPSTVSPTFESSQTFTKKGVRFDRLQKLKEPKNVSESGSHPNSGHKGAKCLPTIFISMLFITSVINSFIN